MVIYKNYMFIYKNVQIENYISVNIWWMGKGYGCTILVKSIKMILRLKVLSFYMNL